MNKRMWKQWERALRGAAFSRQYPSDLPGYLPALGQRLLTRLGQEHR